MKKIVCIILAGIVCAFPSCKQADNLYIDHLVTNGVTYPGIALNPEARSGRERIEIVWKNGADPNVVKARIYWRNFTEWEDVNVPSDADTIRHIIDPLQESTYSFMIRTYDSKGNISVPVEVLGAVYGELYESSLLNRVLKSAHYDVGNKSLNLEWHSANKTEVGISLSYMGTQGYKQITIDKSKTSIFIENFDINYPVSYYTIYRPDPTAIDIFRAQTIEKHIQ